MVSVWRLMNHVRVKSPLVKNKKLWSHHFVNGTRSGAGINCWETLSISTSFFVLWARIKCCGKAVNDGKCLLLVQTKSGRGGLTRCESLFWSVLPLCKPAAILSLSLWTGLIQLLAMLTRTSSAHIVHIWLNSTSNSRFSYKCLRLADWSLRIGRFPLQIPSTHHLLEHSPFHLCYPLWAPGHLALSSSSFTLGGVTKAEVKHHTSWLTRTRNVSTRSFPKKE